MLRTFLIVLLTVIISLFIPQRVLALETGYRFPTTCSTNGSSCSAMKIQDTNYNSWSSGSKEVLTTFTDFNVPNDAIIDIVKIKMRVRSINGGTGSGQFWETRAFINGLESNPKGCRAVDGWCQFYARSSFNPTTVPYLAYIYDEHIPLTGQDINSSPFKIKLYSNTTSNADIDFLQFNIIYHLGNLPDPLPPNAFHITNGFQSRSDLDGNGSKFFYRQIGLFYNGGKVVLSSTPDGKGSLNFADQISISFNYPYSDNFQYNTYSPGCLAYKESIPPIDITKYFLPSLNKPPGIGFNFYLQAVCTSKVKDISPIYLVVVPDTTGEVLGENTIGFLDLPWDYEGKGMSFSEAALSINSYFDHSYPLLAFLSEPLNFQNQVTTFKNEGRSDVWYSSHNGYDYGLSGGAKLSLGDNVLAAASGMARLVTTCSACGNMIEIDHGNGYQTKYMHLLNSNLILSDPGTTVSVSSGQKIGEVGSTGNSDGAHIHFGVYQDKNDDNNFGDNILDGLTDPFGWLTNEPDPWENYSFNYSGTEKTGNKSKYLWKKSLGEKTENLSSNTAAFSLGKFNLSFPAGSISGDAQLKFSPEPSYFSKTLSSIGTTFSAKAKDLLGNEITNFLKSFTLTINFADEDLSKIIPESLAIYSSQDGNNWTKEITNLDLINKVASITISHFTHFSLMGERRDTTAPTTVALLSGDRGQDKWYRSDVELSFNSEDNTGGLGVKYTAYRKPEENWQKYESTLNFTEKGNYKIEFYSEDNDGNVEDVKTIEFNIDKTPPSLITQITVNGTGYDGSWTNQDVLTTFSCTDSLSGVYSFTDPILTSSEEENQRVTGECTDKAGNKSSVETSGINIDKTPPEITLSASPTIIWPPNGKMIPVQIGGSIIESNLAKKTFNLSDEYKKISLTQIDFGDTISLEAKRNGNDTGGRLYTLTVFAEDKAGNQSNAFMKILVPHDKQDDLASN